MFSERIEAIRDEAGQETLRRVRTDAANAPRQIQPLLRYIADHLFDPGLNVNLIKRECGVRDTAIQTLFHRAVGLPPAAYIREHRFQTAARLLERTDLKVWQIAELVGYSLSVFSAAFASWSGKRPSSYRKEAMRKKASDQSRPWMPVSEHELRIMARGELPTEQALSLIRRLTSSYTVRGGAASAKLASELQAIETAEIPLAKEVYNLIRTSKLSFKEQRSVVTQGFRFRSPALFNLLRVKSRVDCRGNRSRGVELAELALDSLYAIGRLEPEYELMNLRARGWAWLANALRLAFRLPEAKRAIEVAEASIPVLQRDALVWAEILMFKAGICWSLRELEEASSLIETVLKSARDMSESDLYARALAVSGVIKLSRADFSDAIEDFLEALPLAEQMSDTYFELSVLQNLANLYARSASKPADAREYIRRARQLLAHHGDHQASQLMVSWSSALIDSSANESQASGETLLDIREEYLQLNEVQNVCLISFDLACFYMRRRELKKASQLAQQHLRIFEALNMKTEAMIAKNILIKQMANGATYSILKQLAANYFLFVRRQNPEQKRPALDS